MIGIIIQKITLIYCIPKGHHKILQHSKHVIIGFAVFYSCSQGQNNPNQENLVS